MDETPIANLEAELGCLEQNLPVIAPRRDHGNSDTFFKPPKEASSCLENPSKTKSIHTFGDNGTLAWATPAGELFSIASCVGKRLIGVECKKGMERGADFESRVEMLDEIIDLPQREGYGIGFSLNLDLQPTDVSWIHNRWPRFNYKHEALDIRLQYYIDSHRVIQQYQIRNTGHDEADLPYTVSSDVCFWEHRDGRDQVQPVPTGMCPERLLLFQNSEVLIRNTTNKAQLKMTAFHNGQRIALWADQPGSDDDGLKSGDKYPMDDSLKPAGNDPTDDDKELGRLDDKLRDRLKNTRVLSLADMYKLKSLYSNYYDRDSRRNDLQPYEQKKFAVHGGTWALPAGSTQEFSLIIHITDILRVEFEPKSAAFGTFDTPSDDQPIDALRPSLITAIFNSELIVREEVGFLGTNTTAYMNSDQADKLIEHFFVLGTKYTEIGWMGEAGYNYHMACLCVESFFSNDTPRIIKARLLYAKFLNDHGWRYATSRMLDKAFDDLSTKSQSHEVESAIMLWADILEELASMYLNTRNFSKAEALYERAFQDVTKDVEANKLKSAHYLERVAYVQACQREYPKAETNYCSLLAQGSLPQGTLCCNLGFIKRKQRQYREAQEYYERALEKLGTNARSNRSGSHHSNRSDSVASRTDFQKPGTEVTYTIDGLFALSGLSCCVRTSSHNNINATAKISSYLTEYLDMNPLLFQTQHLGSVFNMEYLDMNPALFHTQHSDSVFKKDSLHFAMARHLECILSVCSIPSNWRDDVLGTAFVDAHPINCTYEARPAYFQFRYLIQCHRYINTLPDNAKIVVQTADRIREACKSHLIWIFHIVEMPDRWGRVYSIDGTYIDYSGDTLTSLAVQGSFQFLKLCLYHDTWKEDWKFVLNLLHLKLENWLKYLDSTKHMDNLWVEGEDTESFKIYDTSLGDSNYVFENFPRYDISDAAMIWLSLTQLEKLIISIEARTASATQHQVENRMIKEVRQWLKARQNTLSPQRILSGVSTTFTIPKEEPSIRSTAGGRASGALIANTSGKQKIMPVGESDSFSSRNSQRVQVETSGRAGPASLQAKQVIIFRRKTKECVLDVQPRDFPIIEAADLGIFEESHNTIHDAWKETLKLQRDKDISTFEDPRQIALAVLASRLSQQYISRIFARHSLVKIGTLKDVSLQRFIAALHDSGSFSNSIIDNAPHGGSSRTYETASLVLGLLFETCHRILPSHNHVVETPSPRSAFTLMMSKPTPQTRIPLTMPGSSDTPSRMNQEDINDTGFLPDWMYYYPDFFHKEILKINVQEQIKDLDFQSLESAINSWESSESFHFDQVLDLPFLPKVVDSGAKKYMNAKKPSAERQMKIAEYYLRDEFWRRLLEPRSPKSAKKRLIELSSHDRRSVLICWLTAPEKERPFLMDFFRRHESSENFYGERASNFGNLWDTELHLGFYQILDDKEYERFSRYSISKKQPHDQQASSLSDIQQIVPVAMSFRFTGDLRDRFWTCHFLSSIMHGYTSLVDEYFRSENDPNTFYSDKKGQRKLLELIYVERALSEMRRSIDGILDAFKKKLETLGTPSQQEDNFEFIHDQSSPPLKASAILSDVLQQLDSSIRVIEQWEKREDTRGHRSRWSHKDQNRYGEKLRTLTLKCKTNIQNLRVQRSRLGDQRRDANQQHSNLLSYKQLQEARTSTQSAADVRLFTYVTIIFLPLSFSSSLFSMAGTPRGDTVAVMIPTTVIALVVTFLLLANLKLMDRHWSSRVDKLYAYTRDKMQKEEPSGFWKKISEELEKTTKQKLVKPNPETQLLAESQWYYILFWLTFAFESSVFYVRDAVLRWFEPCQRPILTHIARLKNSNGESAQISAKDEMDQAKQKIYAFKTWRAWLLRKPSPTQSDSSQVEEEDRRSELRSTSINANDDLKDMHSVKQQTSEENGTSDTENEHPRRMRRFLRRSREPKFVSEEPRVWVGWSV